MYTINWANKSLHWIFTTLRSVKTSELKRCVKNDEPEAEMENDRFLILFDLLGFSKLVESRSPKDVIKVFHALFSAVAISWRRLLIDLAGKYTAMGQDHVVLESPTWVKLEQLNKQLQNGESLNPNDLLNDVLSDVFPLNGYVLSDTLLIYSAPVSNQDERLTGLEVVVSLCRLLLAQGFLSGIPLRGAVTFGHFHADPPNHIFFGRALVDAANLEKEQEWIGCTVGESVRSILREYEAEWTKEGKKITWQKTVFGQISSYHVHLYDVPLKGGRSDLRPVINWHAPIIGKMRISDGMFDKVLTGEPSVDAKYENTLAYLKWWDRRHKSQSMEEKLKLLMGSPGRMDTTQQGH